MQNNNKTQKQTKNQSQASKDIVKHLRALVAFEEDLGLVTPVPGDLMSSYLFMH